MKRHLGKHEFADKVMENRKRFYCIAYSYVKNEQDALDIISEATCKGLLHLKELDNPRHPGDKMLRLIQLL